MLPVDTLVTIGLSVVSLGTINETDGCQEHVFRISNAGTETVTLRQAYTSCGCVRLKLPSSNTIEPGDTVNAVLSFDPSGKGGEFYERGSIVYGTSRKRIDLVMTGYCVTSEETLLRQYPIRVNECLRLSADRFDLGLMTRGETKTRNIVILHRDEDNRTELVTVAVTAEDTWPKGTHHVKKQIKTYYKNQLITIDIQFDLKII